MPFIIIKSPDGGYKVCKRDNPKICFSTKGIPLLTAKKQMSAIGISEKNTKTGAGAEPDERDFNQLAKGAYDGSVPSNYQLIDQSPTIKIYKKNDDNTIIISVRGSADLRDWKTNFTALPFNRLNKSDRYIEDRNFVGNAIQKYSNGNDIYITAHSLGGAVADQLQKDFPQIKSGLSFNPAYQASDFFNPQETTIKRKYHQDDVLGMLGRYLPQSTVETQKPKNFIEKVIGKTPSIFDRLKGHLLNAFESSKTGGTARFDTTDAGVNQIVEDRYKVNKKNKKVDYLQPAQNNNLKKPIDIQTNNDDNKKTVINVYNGKGKPSFFNQLEKLKIDHKQYLKIAKDRAKQKGYDPKLLFFSNDGIHKLEYDNTPFGRVGYKDFIIYTLTEPKKAEQARDRFHKSHSKINDSGRFSPNQLALNINW